MDLWIRSQDKRDLLKVNGIGIIDNSIATVSLNLQGTLTLGHYKTKERALEVLEEIQELLMPKTFTKNIIEYIPDYNTTGGGIFITEDEPSTVETLSSTYVYEMPKE